MPNYLVHGRLVGCAIAQVIEADDAETAAEIFADADWRPVVASVSDAPVGVIPGRTTLTVTVPTESAQLREHRAATARYKLRFEAWPDFIALLNTAAANLYPLSAIEVHIPDQVVSFDADLTLGGLRLLCEQVEDGHVMEETVAREADDTGERGANMNGEEC